MSKVFEAGRRAARRLNRHIALQIGLTGMLLLASAAQAQEQANELPFNERPAEANIVMSTSNGKYDGNYDSSLLARVCGEVPGELNFAGVPEFLVQYFPDTGQGAINDITFSSKELVGGVVQSTVFFLSVVVHSDQIGSPSAYVLDTAQPKMHGTAALTFPEPGTLELTVHGVNDRGETIQLYLKCLPRE